MTAIAFDLIGDIHGQAPSLERLLDELGYREIDGVYRHPARRVLFVGDFIDGGAHQRRVISIARAMVENNSALAVMGNHEFNALAYGTDDGQGGWLRPHTDKNARQSAAFLQAFPFGSDAYRDVLGWFASLPLWIEEDGLRVVHACWDPVAMAMLRDKHAGPQMTDELLRRSSTKDSMEFNAVETLLKGKEIPLPEGISFPDNYGAQRHHMRIKWWDRSAQSYKALFLGPPAALTHIPDDPVGLDHGLAYDPEDPPLFVGHYWLRGVPTRLAPNVACLDYSIAAGAGGQLVAYRWDGEQALDNGKFVAVPWVNA